MKSHHLYICSSLSKTQAQMPAEMINALHFPQIPIIKHSKGTVNEKWGMRNSFKVPAKNKVIE